ncbi:MAG: hypothetical protein IJH87_05715 [Atopobiaceae bacterium]|nr:hypothetical protein [Atopobiaceae bacterium]
MKHLKKLIGLIAVLVLGVAIAACSFDSSKSFTFEVDTGDSVTVELDTGDGDDIEAIDNGFNIKDEEGNLIAYGIFVDEMLFNQYAQAAYDYGENYKESKLDGNLCVYWEPGEEWDFMVWIEGSNTGIAVVCDSRDTAHHLMDRLTFTVEAE